jgi:hypothetical protein
LLGLRELADDAAKDTDPPMTLGNMRANATACERSPRGASVAALFHGTKRRQLACIASMTR